MGTPESRQRIVFQMQTLKGVCMLGVVLIHVADPWRMNPDHWLTAVVWLVNSLPRFAVPLFFVFTGFHLAINTRNDDPIRLYRRTLGRLIVPYLLYSLIYSLPRAWGTTDWARTVTSDVLYGTAGYHLWFVPVMIRAYLVHPFLIRWYRERRRPEYMVVAALVAAIFWPTLASSIAQSLPRLSIVLGWLLGPQDSWFTAVFTYVAFVICGYYLFDHSDKIQTARRGRLLAALFVWLGTATAIAVLASGTWSAWRAHSLGVLATTLTFAALVAILAFVGSLSHWRPVYRNTLNSFGLYSYGIYYIHPACLHVLRLVLVRALGIRLENPLLYPLLFLLTSLFTLQLVRRMARSSVGRYLT
jgi:surface polysaccharide O-acyltransferase-like enzyme